MKTLRMIAMAVMLAACLPAAAKSAGADELSIIRAEGTRFVDAAGRQVILRGVNAGGRSKLPPFFPFDPTPDFQTALERCADAIRAQGFNVVRLLIIREAAEPVRGSYDEQYLEKYDRMARAFAERGVRVIVDAHQDLASRRFCGDGFPDWMLPEKYRDRPPRSDCKPWNVHYFTAPVGKTLDNLWANRDGARDSHAAFFHMLAERYVDEPAVIGFEPINEPMPGRRGCFNYSKWHAELYELYEKTADAVAAVDPRYIIFADICALENTGTINTRRPRPAVSNLALAPHYYDLGTFGASLEPGGDRWMMRWGVGRHLALAQSWDVPVLVGEYGISPLHQDAPAYIEKIYSVFDEHQLSGTFWEASMSAAIWNFENTSLFDPDGTLRPAAANLDRPYPRAVAGEIGSFMFDPGSGRFELEWIEDPAVSAPTIIYLPARVYGSAPLVSLQGMGGSEYDAAASELRVVRGAGGVRRLTVTPG